MDALKELSDSLKSYFNERISSPLSGSFIVSWLLVNYKFVLLTFSDESIRTKYYIINEVLYPPNAANYLPLFLYPILGALFYIFLYPFPARWTLRYAKWQQGLTSAVRVSYEEQQRLTIEQSRDLKSKIIDIQQEYDRKLEVKDLEVTALKQELTRTSGKKTPKKPSPQKSNKPSPADPGADSVNLSDDSMLILKAIGMRGTSSSIRVLYQTFLANNETTIDQGKFKYHLEILQKLDLVEQDSRGNWGCSAKGREYLYAANETAL